VSGAAALSTTVSAAPQIPLARTQKLSLHLPAFVMPAMGSKQINSCGWLLPSLKHENRTNCPPTLLLLACVRGPSASALGKPFPLQYSSDVLLTVKNADYAHRSILRKEVKPYRFESVHRPGTQALELRVAGMAAHLSGSTLDGIFKAQRDMGQSERNQVIAKLTNEIGLRCLAVSDSH
jgi:hypothetical protein